MSCGYVSLVAIGPTPALSMGLRPSAGVTVGSPFLVRLLSDSAAILFSEIAREEVLSPSTAMATHHWSRETCDRVSVVCLIAFITA